jgi:hypothetical protein
MSSGVGLARPDTQGVLGLLLKHGGRHSTARPGPQGSPWWRPALLTSHHQANPNSPLSLSHPSSARPQVRSPLPSQQHRTLNHGLAGRPALLGSSPSHLANTESQARSSPFPLAASPLPPARRRLPRAQPSSSRARCPRQDSSGDGRIQACRQLPPGPPPCLFTWPHLQGEHADGRICLRGERLRRRPPPMAALPPALPFPLSGPLASLTRWMGRASRVGPARKRAQQAVLGPLAKHDARLSTGCVARRAMSARLPSGRAWHGPVPCWAGPAR